MTDPAKVLVVDDSQVMRAYVTQALQQNWVVEQAENGVEGLEKLWSEPIGLVIVDVNMPKMDGYEFVRRLRSAGQPWSAAPVVMVTSEREDKDRKAAYRVGANLFLVKPINSQELNDVVTLLWGREA